MTMANLLQRALEGDEAAAQSLVDTHQQAVLRLAFSILGDRCEAEEVTQDVFVTALGALDSFRGDASFKTWLFSITINQCRMRLRKRKARDLLLRTLQSVFRIAGAGPAQPEEILIRREMEGELWKAVNALDEKHRLPLLLFYEHDLPVREIAQALNLPVGTVLSRLYTARERLRETLRSGRLQGERPSWEEAGEYEND
jgi:RNA polymerase sigma-70 factor (ECF subfamily)